VNTDRANTDRREREGRVSLLASQLVTSGGVAMLNVYPSPRVGGKLPRRRFLHLAAATAVVPIAMRVALALEYPTRPVHIVVGFAAGINPDIIARLFAQSLSERFKQPFIVEDRPGAASNIGTEAVARAPPDGYTLLAATSTNTINASLYDKLSFNFVRDIAPVAGTVRLPSVLVAAPSFEAKTVPELIAYSKANPGRVTMASPGVGSAAHVIGELFKDDER
jgi:tripartite-type tricarboxylate transporter receptor subunit TctC